MESTLEQALLVRNGSGFVDQWRRSCQHDRDRLAEAGVLIGALLGHGGRGEVWAGKDRRGRDLAVKFFAYPKERAGQSAALGFWSGFAPEVIDLVGERTMLLERLWPATPVAGRSNDLQIGMTLVKKIVSRSPSSRPPGAEALNEHFADRLQRARSRNSHHGLFSESESAEIESRFDCLESEKEVLCHGDFGGNIVFGPRPMVIDPRGYLWGDIHCDLAKWILYRRQGRDVVSGISAVTASGFDQSLVEEWILIQAYDDASAFAALNPEDPRIERYALLVRGLLGQRRRGRPR